MRSKDDAEYLASIHEVEDDWEIVARGLGVDPDAPLTNAMFDRWSAHAGGETLQAYHDRNRRQGMVRDPAAWAKDPTWTLRDHVRVSREWADELRTDGL